MLTCNGGSLVKNDIKEFKEWPLDSRPHLTRSEVQKLQAFNCLYCNYFVLSLEDLKDYRCKLIYIHLEDVLLFRIKSICTTNLEE